MNEGFMLQATNVSHHFDTLLYEDLNLCLAPGESAAVLGVSGSGKSTILNNLSTMLKPVKGKISLFEYDDIYALPQYKLLQIRRYKIGIIFQFHYLFRGFSGIENLRVASILSNHEVQQDLLEILAIQNVINKNVGELSGGQQQRLSIARVLTKRPEIVFADEPTGNLDKATAFSVMKVLCDYIQSIKGVLVLATHDEEIAKQCTHIFKLENKKFLKLG